MSPGFRVFLPIVGLAVGLYAGCSNNAEQAPIENACQGIIDACHTKDDGSVASINDCHTVGHDGVDADCQDQYEACVALCDEAPEVGTHADDGDAGSDDGTPGTTTGADDDGGTTGGSDDGGTTGGTTGRSTGGSTDGGSSTGNDDSSSANCSDLGSGCHDVPGEVPQMCHDVGHDGDETACAAIWVECVEACGL